MYLLAVLCFSVLIILGTFTMANAASSDGTVISFQKISEIEGNFLHLLDDDDKFGHSIENLGDLDGDGTDDLAVGADSTDESRGAIYILFMNNDGTVKSYQKISDTEGGFSGNLDAHDHFGHAVVNLGDLDGDGVVDLAIGAYRDDDGGTDRGAAWILFFE